MQRNSNSYDYERVPGAFESSALRYSRNYARKKNSNQSNFTRESDVNSSQSLASWIASWWGGSEVSTSQTQPVLESTVQAAVIDVQADIDRLTAREQFDIILNAFSGTPEINTSDEISLNGLVAQLQHHSNTIEIFQDTTLVHLINEFALDINRIESGELTQLSIAYEDSEGLTQILHTDLNHLLSDNAVEMLMQLLLQRFHLGQGILFFKATSPMQAAALDLFVSSGQLLGAPLDWQRVTNSLTFLANHNEITHAQMSVMPYSSELIIPNLDMLHDLSRQYAPSPESQQLTNIPNRMLRFIGTYILASRTLASPALLRGLLRNHPDILQQRLLIQNSQQVVPGILLGNLDVFTQRLTMYHVPSHEARVADLDDYIQEFRVLVTQISALVNTPNCRIQNQDATNQLVETLNNKMNAFELNPCHYELIKMKSDIQAAFSQAEAIFENEPGIWREYVMPVINSVISLLNQCLELIRVPTRYHCELFKPEPTLMQRALVASNIKPNLLDDENGLISKMDALLI